MDMCAIAGIWNLDITPQALERMKKTMRRRGPDDFRVFEGRNLALLHARLAVIDPEGGRQPMTLTQAGETFTIIYNGELYNTPELRRELKKLGHSFRGHSDTEVLLHSYAQWGKECLEKLNGIFAFAVWEEKSERLFLARDRIGVKPLFFTRWNGGFLFASELKTILAYPGFRAAIDREGASELLLLGPGRTPGCGVFKGVEELEPGCWGELNRGEFRIHRYWKLTDGEHPYDFGETLEQVRFLVTDAIRRQLVSDVNIGCFLSGGLDSSLICAVAARELEQQGKTLPTFSVDYTDNSRYFVPGKFQPNSDADYIGVMEEFLHCRPHRIMLSPGELVNALEEATMARDLPGMADVDYSLLLLCREVRKEVTVALSGECADEIFGGYPWYRDPEIRQREGFPWAQSTALRAGLLAFDPGDPGRAEEYIRCRYDQTITESHINPDQSPLEKRMKQMMNLNFRWFMQTLLDRKDRMSMHASLEVRVPFCDWRIAELLYRVPWEMKDAGGWEKGLLRKAMEGLLPEKVLWRKKSPYPKTFHPEYERLIRQRLDALRKDPKAPLWQLVNRERIPALTEKEMVWPWYGQLMGKPQTMAYLVSLDFWLRHYNVDLIF